MAVLQTRGRLDLKEPYYRQLNSWAPSVEDQHPQSTATFGEQLAGGFEEDKLISNGQWDRAQEQQQMATPYWA